jgi:predicted nucleic acid-binding protein
MNCVFADTWFFLAALNRADANHARALAASRAERRHRVTTDWSIEEVGDALCRASNRDVFGRFYDWVHQHPATTIVPATRQLLDEGVRLFRHRPDKNWPLTDGISFVVMDDEGIHDALTGDRHFELTGFTALLK